MDQVSRGDILSTRIELLTSLQRLDQSISERKRETEEGVRQLQALEAIVQERVAEAAQLKETLAELKSRQMALERELAEIEDKAKDRRMRLQRIRNDKELQATQREIDVMKERAGQLEDDELQVLEEVDTFTEKMSAAQENLQEGEQALEQERTASVARESEVAQEVDRNIQARKELAARIASVDGVLVRRYELIFSRRGGVAIVAVRAGIFQ